jgi:formylglycine-generating enzyme
VRTEPTNCCAPSLEPSGPTDVQLLDAQPFRPHEASRNTKGQRPIPAGNFEMGDHFGEGYSADGEGPVHWVRLEAFSIDSTTVTNAQYARFVRDTGYVTDAEQLGVSAVFHLAVEADRSDILHRVDAAPWWLAVRGACWLRPEGPRSTLRTRPNHPVVHMSWNDADAYCRWVGKRLPTEAEWEYAARGELEGRRFAWGDELVQGGSWRCNIWQGDFPHTNTIDDGYLTTAPVNSYRPNGYGLWNTAGNVWEWCADWFSADYYTCSPEVDPRGPSSGTQRVMRGGSFLCHSSYCNRYRVAARSSNAPDSTSANVGFRCAND